MVTEEQFGKGAHKDRVDNRDYKWQDIALARAIAPFDWSVGYDIETEIQNLLKEPLFRLPVKNQGGSSSCGGQAWSTYVSILELFSDHNFEERSAKFIYAQDFAPGGGSYGRDNCNICINQGCARESVLSSYDNGQPPGEVFMARPQDITSESRTDAITAKELSYAAASPDIETIAQALRENYGGVVGVTGANNGTWASPFPAPPNTTEDPRLHWNHWMYFGKAKLINGKKYVKVLNSWGPTVGDNGWQWLSEDYFNAAVDANGDKGVFQGWTMLFKGPQLPPPSFKHTFNQDMHYFDRNDEVRALQQALIIDGEFPAGTNPTGFYGEITRKAVLSFQIKYQVDAAATLAYLAGKSVGPKTRAKLNQLFS